MKCPQILGEKTSSQKYTVITLCIYLLHINTLRFCLKYLQNDEKKSFAPFTIKLDSLKLEYDGIYLLQVLQSDSEGIYLLKVNTEGNNSIFLRQSFFPYNLRALYTTVYLGTKRLYKFFSCGVIKLL